MCLCIIGVVFCLLVVFLIVSDKVVLGVRSGRFVWDFFGSFDYDFLVSEI